MSDSLEARVQRLEDIEEIGKLKARYCDHCDKGYRPDGIADLFTEDGVWDGGNTFGRREGREAIRRHFQKASERVAIARHQVMNPIIEVDGDQATGQWLLFQPCTDAGVDGAVWLAATYHDKYRRVDGRWLFAETVIDVAFFSAFEKGWAVERYLPGRAPAS
ncbi:MAG: nuclear transport factor 2 family protein [Actinomycetia bacterium]|nr:nuclear transport factor 2 family protein [Actinomycetes bacterium]